MTRFEVDRACGQTPCLCGDIETWHPKCFTGKTDVEIAAGYDRAYKIARRKLRANAMKMVANAMGMPNDLGNRRAAFGASWLTDELGVLKVGAGDTTRNGENE